ncbi:Tesmin, partial [Camelus dromedarius]
PLEAAGPRSAARAGGDRRLSRPRRCRCHLPPRIPGDAWPRVPSVDMEDTPLLGRMSSPEDEMVTNLFSAESQFVSENLPLKSPVAVKHEEDEFHVLKDAYLGAADPREPLLHTFNPPLSVDCKNKVKVELLMDENEDEEVEIKEAGGSITSNNLEEATFQNPLAQESCGKFSSSQEREDASGCSQKKDLNPMVTMPGKMCLTNIILSVYPFSLLSQQ